MTACSLRDLATCLPQKFFEFILSILNEPLKYLLKITKDLLTESVNIQVFGGLWSVIIYIISLFFGIFLIIAGFNFIISGYNAAKREKAKSWLANIILMIIFVQASYFIYKVLIDINNNLTKGIFSLINPTFFSLTFNNFGDIGLQLILIIPYLIILVITALLLGLRYLLVSIGVVLFPIALFLYFIPPLKDYGKMLLSLLLIIIFVTFFDVIILLGASILTNTQSLSNIRIILVISAFLTINLFMLFLIIFSFLKAAFSVMNSDVGKSVTKAVKYIV
ncbi:MAG TPA: hypothetical protein VJH20_04600 [Candidatus Nanoarchaeia archaeon]|nr:hypothetical protein [Candidatus Nanoarchaeia archaeon]